MSRLFPSIVVALAALFLVAPAAHAISLPPYTAHVVNPVLKQLAEELTMEMNSAADRLAPLPDQEPIVARDRVSELGTQFVAAVRTLSEALLTQAREARNADLEREVISLLRAADEIPSQLALYDYAATVGQARSELTFTAECLSNVLQQMVRVGL